MKKSFLMIAVSAMLVLSVTSCQEDKTGEDYLIDAKNGWELKNATSVPAYVKLDGTEVSNLMNGFMESCEVDDIMYFKNTDAQTIDPGKDKQTTNDDFDCVERGEKSLGNWSIANDEKSFTSFYLPYFPGDNYGHNGLTEILSLDKDNLIVNVRINDGANNVIFTLTYARK